MYAFVLSLKGIEKQKFRRVVTSSEGEEGWSGAGQPGAPEPPSVSC